MNILLLNPPGPVVTFDRLNFWRNAWFHVIHILLSHQRCRCGMNVYIQPDVIFRTLKLKGRDIVVVLLVILGSLVHFNNFLVCRLDRVC